ncbi:IclR family transcriptional regulator [Arthrobacter sp. MA-N2]|uniref:IclR family transcriptional regulator n=1 Tax=Arthrobacter sp. MA-N2 TaxID=1101188 RepID=UPI0009E09B91|nr:IclR family transcriptional regulator [Arthrobacter sp. MA-N2]
MEQISHLDRGGARWSSAVPSPAVLRAEAILKVLAESQGTAVSVGRLAAQAQVPRSSAVNICAALRQSGIVIETDDGFFLGPRLLELGQAYLSSLDPLRRFTDLFRGVDASIAETVQLATLDGTEVVYLAKHDGNTAIRIASKVGLRLPANCTGLGKAMLATLKPDDRMSRLQAASPLPARTRHSKVAIPELLEELEEIADRGYAIDDEETTEGILCVAAAVPEIPADVGIYGISVTILKSLATDARINELVASVKGIAKEVARPS